MLTKESQVMRLTQLFFTIPILAAAMGCASLGDMNSSQPMLLGTEWRLVEFRSSDDSIGTVQPRPDEVYTLRFAPDGTFVARLACNRGNGRWVFESATAERGGISIELGATTRAACSPGALTRWTTDAAQVRSYVLEGGRLHLNLAVDAGTYVWHRTE
jgi:heat shock protein HslJ